MCHPTACFDRGGLDHDHADTSLRELPIVHEMPVIRQSLMRRVLAHRANNDSIGERGSAECQRREEPGLHSIADSLLD